MKLRPVCIPEIGLRVSARPIRNEVMLGNDKYQFYVIGLTQLRFQLLILLQSISPLCVTYRVTKGQFVSYHAYMVWKDKDPFSR